MARVVDDRGAAGGRVEVRGRQLGEAGRAVPAQLRRQQQLGVEPCQVGRAGGPDEVRREPLVEGGQQGLVAPVGPLVATEVMADERDTRPQQQRTLRPLQRGESGGAHALDECGDGGVAGGGGAHLLVEQHSTEASFDAQDQVVALLVPHDGLAPFDLVGQRRDHVVDVERGADADAGVVALAVEIGCDDEPFVGERIGRRRPCRRAGAQLELPRLTTAHGDAIRVGERQRDAGASGPHVVEIESHAGALRDVGGAVAHSSHVS